MSQHRHHDSADINWKERGPASCATNPGKKSGPVTHELNLTPICGIFLQHQPLASCLYVCIRVYVACELCERDWKLRSHAIDTGLTEWHQARLRKYDIGQYRPPQFRLPRSGTAAKVVRLRAIRIMVHFSRGNLRHRPGRSRFSTAMTCMQGRHINSTSPGRASVTR